MESQDERSVNRAASAAAEIWHVFQISNLVFVHIVFMNNFCVAAPSQLSSSVILVHRGAGHGPAFRQYGDIRKIRPYLMTSV